MNRSDSTAPFFVVGADRSGTTMLRLMLNEQSRLHIPHESYFMSAVMNHLPLAAPLRPDQIVQLANLIHADPRWCDWGISYPQLTSTLARLNRPTLGEAIDAVFRIPAQAAAKPRWGDKTPRYVREIPRLRIVFPQARFIHIIRDGRDVCLSLKTTRWHGDTVYEIADYWASSVGAGLRDGRPLGPDVYLEVSYEDLVLQPEPVLRRVCEFLGEDFEPAMLQFHEHASQNIVPWEQAIHSKLLRPPKSDDTYRWRREMSWQDVAIFEGVAGRVMDQVGQARHFHGAGRVIAWSARTGVVLINLSRPARHVLGLTRHQERKPPPDQVPSGESAPTPKPPDHTPIPQA